MAELPMIESDCCPDKDCCPECPPEGCDPDCC
jgi:hypothetical protein